MAGLGLLNLPLPPLPFRLDLMVGPTGEPCMQSRDEARAEDTLRFRMLQRLQQHPLIDGQAKAILASELMRRRPQTLSSSLHVRLYKPRIIGGLMQVDAEGDWDRSSTFTAVPMGWDCSSAEFDRVDPRLLINGFRSDLNRCGASSASGCLAAFLHGEYEPGTDRYQLHLHGFAAEGMIDVLDEARRLPKYRSIRSHFDPGQDTVCQRMRISRQRPTPRQFSYLLQSWWPSRWIGPVGDDGDIRRSRTRHRIPEPYHSQYLLWLDRWSLSDISLFMKLRVTRAGLQVADAYTNGASQ